MASLGRLQGLSVARLSRTAVSRRFPQQAQVTGQRYASGMGFSVGEMIRNTFGGGVRKEDKKEDVEKAIAAQEERGDANLFDSAEKVLERTSDEVQPLGKPKKKFTEHKYSTASFKMSHRKLNMLGRQIAGKPIDAAILQMVFSEKRASTRIKSMLCVARDHAETYKGLDRSRLIVSESWVSKGEKLARVDIKGRGRAGIKHHPKARLTVVLREGKTPEEKSREERAYKVNKIRSASLMRDNKPIRNPGPMWAW